MKNLLIAGGAGFIGSNFVRAMAGKYPHYNLIVYDKLTYAGNLDNLLEVSDEPQYHFVRGDICDPAAVSQIIGQFEIDTIVNFAAETHVDRSFLDPDAFIKTDVYGTYVLLEAARKFGLERFHQVSTDEVYGHVPYGHSSLESDNLAPRSPYAASKAGGDLMALAYFTTYRLPVTLSRGSNNVGPYQYPEKVVPLFATNAIDYEPLPIYGDGRQMRDYQHVEEHCRAIDLILHQGELGEVYNIATGEEMENLMMVEILLEALDRPLSLVRYVADRPGHDRRYSLNIDKIRSLGWQPALSPAEAIVATARWYQQNEWWWRKVKKGDYQNYYETQYGWRLAAATQ